MYVPRGAQAPPAMRPSQRQVHVPAARVTPVIARRNPAVRSTTSGVLTVARFPVASVQSSATANRPSGAGRPAASRPVQETAPDDPVSAHLWIRAVPRRIRSVPVPALLLVQASRALSAMPSPSGLNVGGVAVRPRTGGVVSTTTVPAVAAGFPAASRTASVSVYEPSATTDPSSAFPSHVAFTTGPAPASVRTAGPPDAGPTTSDQLTASGDAEPVTTTLSNRPSPFGERRPALMAARLSEGGRVSTVTPTTARWAGVAGVAEGHATGTPAAVPASWST